MRQNSILLWFRRAIVRAPLLLGVVLLAFSCGSLGAVDLSPACPPGIGRGTLDPGSPKGDEAMPTSFEAAHTTFAACRVTSRLVSLPPIYLLDILALTNRLSLYPEEVFVHAFVGHLRPPSGLRADRHLGLHPTSVAR